MKKLCILLVLFLFLAGTARAATQIQDTAYTGIGGATFNGKVLINAPDMTTADGRTVVRWQQEFTITNGVIAVNLEPNDTAVPSGTSYVVRFTPRSGASWAERWLVPTSGSPLKVNQVRISTTPTPALTIQPSQVLSGGAASGQCLSWSGSSWIPGPCGVSPVASVFGRTGAITPQTGDYTFPQISGTVTNSQLASGVDAAKIGAGSVDNTELATLDGVTASIQSQLNARMEKGTVVYWVDDYCQTPGVYDHTCLNGAVSAAGSATDVTIQLGPRVYLIGATVNIASKTRWRLAGLERRAKLRAANALNAPMVVIDTCADCIVSGLHLDGNAASQSSEAIPLSILNHQGVTITGNLIENVRGRGLRITIASGFNSNQMGVLLAQNTIDRTTDEALHAVVGSPGILASSNRFTNIDTDANGTPSTGAIYLEPGDSTSVFLGTLVQGYIAPDFSSFANLGSAFRVNTSGFGLRVYLPFLRSVFAGSTCTFVNQGECNSAYPTLSEQQEFFHVGTCVGGTPVLNARIVHTSGTVSCVGPAGFQVAAIELPDGAQQEITVTVANGSKATGSDGWVRIIPFGYAATTVGNMAFSLNVSVCADVAWDLSTGPAFNAATGSISYSVGNLSNSPISTAFVKVLGGDSINGGSWVFASNTNCRGGLVGTPRPSYVRLVRRGDLSNDSNTGSLFVTGFVTLYSSSLY